MKNPKNVILQGDSLSLMQNLPSESVDLIIADPPYNLSKGSEISISPNRKLPGMGGAWDKTMEHWDNIDLSDYLNFTISWLKECQRILKPTGSMWIFGSYHNIGIVNVACQALSLEIINEVIWYKPNAFPNLAGRRLTASHETILWVHKGNEKSRKYYFNYEQSKSGDYNYDSIKKPGKQMRTVWEIANNKERREIRFGKHPTQKPLRILKRIIELSSEPGDLVFTPFAGAGSECLAALELNRDYLGFELEQEYIEIANKRLANAHTEPTSQNLSKQADTDSHEGKLF